MEGLNARAYIRVSTEEQALSGYSLAAQRDRLEAFARSQGWTVAAIYEDDGCSAKDMNRPALQRLLQEALSGEVVLVYRLDRLTRSVVDLYELMRRFDSRGLLFKSATEEFNTTTSHGRLMIALVAVLAQWERETIAERVKMGRHKKAASGEWPGGPIPFGYLGQPSGKAKGGRPLLRLVPDPNKAHIVRSIFDRYLFGQGLRALCLWLNDELGVRTTGGSRWRAESVRRILTNPIYCGKVVDGRRGQGTVTETRGDHEPLVSVEVFQQVRQLLRLHREMAPRQAVGHYPLAGVARCGRCGGGIAVHVRRKEGLYYYKCLNWHKGAGCGAKPLTSVPGHVAEKITVRRISSLPLPAHLGQFLRQCEADPVNPARVEAAELSRLETDLAETQQAVRRWELAYETGKLDLDEYLRHVRPHGDRIKLICGQLDHLRGKSGALRSSTTASFQADFDLVWGHADPAERKMLLQRFVRSFGVKIVLCPGQQVHLVPEM